MLGVLHQVATAWHLRVNYAKCESVCMQPTTGGDTTARPPLSVPETCEAIAWFAQARFLGLMTTENPSLNPHLHKRLAAAGKACCRCCGARAACARGPCCTTFTLSQPFSTLYRRLAASQTTSCSRSSPPTMATCAGSPA
eukprot:362749-Chlamydomonas_euryale.AAC.9